VPVRGQTKGVPVRGQTKGVPVRGQTKDQKLVFAASPRNMQH
jgi:hypothetical protein